MKSFRQLLPGLLLAALLTAFQGCETTSSSEEAARREAMNAAIRAEVPGNYFVGRRMYKKDYKVWGWVRQPGQPWSTAKLVMLNEQKVLAPDRQRGQIGADNLFEYRLEGYFSGQTVYEPASDGFYPEFVLTNYEVRSTNPPNIYVTPQQQQPEVRILAPPR